MDSRDLRELELLDVVRLYEAPPPAPVPEPAPPRIPAPAASRPVAAPGEEVAAAAGAALAASLAPQASWEELRRMVADCRACGLCRQRKQAVFGVGAEDATWMFVGEGPGAEEDASGEPFVGQAGKLLDSMLEAIGCRRGREVYIANVVKCRPPGNRKPEPGEAAACAPFLDRQVELVRPKLIVALGATAAQRLLAVDSSIASLRGRVHRYQGIPVVVTYHPAYLLRTLPDKAKAWEDLLFARATIAAAP